MPAEPVTAGVGGAMTPKLVSCDLSGSGRVLSPSRVVRTTVLFLVPMVFLCLTKPSVGQEDSAPPLPESQTLGSDDLPRDANGQPDFSTLPFVREAEPPPANVKARIEALHERMEASAAESLDEPALPALPVLPEEPLSPPRMDSGDPNPDGINAPSKADLLGEALQ